MSNDFAFVELVDKMGGDLSVCNAARVSFGKHSMELSEKDERLIHRLMRDKHGSVFEMAVMTFYIRCPIFVAREWVRHRMASYNEFSARYSEMPTEFFVPDHFRVPNPDTKQMDYKYLDAPLEVDKQARDIVNEAHDHAEKAYKDLLELGIAKEHARIVVPVSIFTEFRWTVNARSLMNFLSLRTAPGAMSEIRSYANFVEELWKGFMPVTHAAFDEYGRIAP